METMIIVTEHSVPATECMDFEPENLPLKFTESLLVLSVARGTYIP